MSDNDNSALDFDSLAGPIGGSKTIGQGSQEDLPPSRQPVRVTEATEAPVKAKKPEMENVTVRMEVTAAMEFRALCKQERYSHGEMVAILVEAYKNQ